MRNILRLWVIIAISFVCTVGLSVWMTIQTLQSNDEENLPTTSTPTSSSSATDSYSSKSQDYRLPRDRVIASVGNQSIYLYEFYRTLEKYEGQVILKQMIDHRVIELEAQESGIEVTNTEVENELKKMQKGYQNETQYFNYMKNQLGLTKTQIEQDLYYKLLLIKIATQSISISDQEVEAYMAINSEEFQTKWEYRLNIIVLPSMEKANSTLKEIKSGADFTKLAREISLDDLSASSGGDLGWVEENDLFYPTEIMSIAKTLQIGQWSQPFKLNERYAILLLQNRRKVSQPEKNILQEEVRQELALLKAVPLDELKSNLKEKWRATILDESLK
jgi:foldase protein PrsA